MTKAMSIPKGLFLQSLLTAALALGVLTLAVAPAQAQQDMQPMRFVLVDNDRECSNCRYIGATGDIMPFTAAQFRQFVRSHGLEAGGLTVMLHSGGGDVVAGVRLGRAFRRFGFDTRVGRAQRMPRRDYLLRSGDCASACSYAFLGGVKRYADDDRLGIHRFYPAHLEPDVRVIERPGDDAVATMIRVYALDMGVDPYFIDASMDVPPADMLYMMQDELRAFDVVNIDEPQPLYAASPKGQEVQRAQR